MKRALLTGACLTIFLMVTAGTCKEDDVVPQPTLKDYTCKCTYVPMSGSPSDGQPNKEETNTVKGEDNTDAKIECDDLAGKYIAQYFSGTCLIQ